MPNIIYQLLKNSKSLFLDCATAHHELIRGSAPLTPPGIQADGDTIFLWLHRLEPMTSSILVSSNSEWTITHGLSIASEYKWHVTSTNISLTDSCCAVPPDGRGKEQSKGTKRIFDDHYCFPYIPTTPLDNIAEKKKYSSWFLGFWILESQLNTEGELKKHWCIWKYLFKKLIMKRRL